MNLTLFFTISTIKWTISKLRGVFSAEYIFNRLPTGKRSAIWFGSECTINFSNGRRQLIFKKLSRNEANEWQLCMRTPKSLKWSKGFNYSLEDSFACIQMRM